MQSQNVSDQSVRVAEWVRSPTIWLHCTTSQTDPGSNPGAGTANQAIYPSGVGKLVAVSKQWVTAVEGCGDKSVRLYDGWRAAYVACAWCKLPHVGFL
jgi:hypothetical protein